MTAPVSGKTLYILRHAKAETGAPTQDDHDRVLAGRGVQDAQAIGKYVAAKGYSPEFVLCSTALRARQTWDHVQETCGRDFSVDYLSKLYMASANEILNILAQVPESVPSLLIVGHNPGFHELCMKLSKSGDEKLLEDARLKFPTCALAAVQLDTGWAGIAKARGELLSFKMPNPS